MSTDMLCHHGIKGQKWGVRRFQNENGTYTDEGKQRYKVSFGTRHKAKKDAKEFARAKMFYGEGAGNRRKLIKATVSERSKDAGFDRFEKKKKVESKRGKRGAARMESGRKDDWRQFFQGGPIELVGEEPDFSEEGWARRKPKKKGKK